MVKFLTASKTILQRLSATRDISSDLSRNGLPANARGFTLLEVVAVCAILGLLVGLGIPAYKRFLGQAKIVRCEGEIRAIQSDIIAYMVDHDGLPDSLADINRDTLLDPYGNPYQYLKIVNDPAAARKGLFDMDLNIDFDLYSMGPGGTTTQKIKDAAGLDDIIRASEGGFIGTGLEF